MPLYDRRRIPPDIGSAWDPGPARAPRERLHGHFTLSLVSCGTIYLVADDPEPAELDALDLLIGANEAAGRPVPSALVEEAFAIGERYVHDDSGASVSALAIAIEQAAAEP